MQRVWLLVMAAFLAAVARPSCAAEAPFGLRWGPVATVPQPSMVDREGNITVLIHEPGQPPALGADTQRIVLEVCREEELQKVIWLSRPLSDVEFPAKYTAIFQEGLAKLGAPVVEDGSQRVRWPHVRISLFIRQVPTIGRRLIMTVTAGQYEACSAVHEAETGHSAEKHTNDLLSKAMQQ